eukprot:Amastigsp_a451_56.p2 type:complete len:104 gc:universal Amastigsp_a451_56:149-460(+)
MPPLYDAFDVSSSGSTEVGGENPAVAMPSLMVNELNMLHSGSLNASGSSDDDEATQTMFERSVEEAPLPAPSGVVSEPVHWMCTRSMVRMESCDGVNAYWRAG